MPAVLLVWSKIPAPQSAGFRSANPFFAWLLYVPQIKMRVREANTLSSLLWLPKVSGRLALWLITKRAVRPTAIGNLPDLPAATPHPLHHLADTTPVNQRIHPAYLIASFRTASSASAQTHVQVVSRGGSRPPSTAAAVPGAHTTSASMLDTPVSGGPASVAASGFSGWPSSVKRCAHKHTLAYGNECGWAWAGWGTVWL
eukprot:1159156-Pelagomonas_calceolata.AAC.5